MEDLVKCFMINFVFILTGSFDRNESLSAAGPAKFRFCIWLEQVEYSM